MYPIGTAAADYTRMFPLSSSSGHGHARVRREGLDVERHGVGAVRVRVVRVVLAAHAVLHHLVDADGDAGGLGGMLLHLDGHLDALPLLLQHLHLQLGLVAPALVVDQQRRRRATVVAVRTPG